MNEKEAKEFIRNRLGNDYYFLPIEAEKKWIDDLVEADIRLVDALKYGVKLK